MTFAFTPSDGYRNTVSFPTKPANETAFRDSMQDLLDQVATELNTGTNSASGVANMSRQAVMNGNFDIWQRGTSFTNPTGYIPDRWRVGANSADSGTFPTITVAKSFINPEEVAGGASYNILRLTTTGAGSSLGAASSYSIDQNIENGTRYLCGTGRKITLSFWARSTIAGKKIGATMYQFYGTGGSPSPIETINGSNFTLTSSFQKFTVTFNTNPVAGKGFGTNNDDYFIIRFFYQWGSGIASNVGAASAESFVGAGDIDIAQVQVNAGASALPFQPKTIEQELRACQRYYEKSHDITAAPGSVTQTGEFNYNTRNTVPGSTAGAIAVGYITYRVTKRINPTMIIYSPSGLGFAVKVNNGSDRAGVTAVSGQSGFNALSFNNSSAVAINPDNAIEFQWAADAEL